METLKKDEDNEWTKALSFWTSHYIRKANMTLPVFFYNLGQFIIGMLGVGTRQ